MKKLISIIFIIGLAIIPTLSFVYAYRIPKPQRITDFDQNGLVILNETLENLWDVTNGRFNLNLVTTNPDGSVKGNAGDMVLLKSGGNYYIEVCIGGTQWLGEQLSDTP